MHILLSNDDGLNAPGLQALAEVMAELGRITVVAPDRNRSGASNSLTLVRPLRVVPVREGQYQVDGTPTDCVHLALTGLLDEPPDLVVSGINSGPNLGDDVLYSGTVAAALEGRWLGLPAIAISMASEGGAHYHSAARVALKLVKDMLRQPLPGHTMLNINVPSLPYEELGPWQVTRLGHRHKALPAVMQRDPRGDPVYWVGPAGAAQDAGAGTDFAAIQQGQVSITPIKVDMTDHAQQAALQDWVQDLS